jgi:DNA-binding transcriptional LysR family regulator
VLAATVAGAGVSVLPVYLCRAHLAAGTLIALHEPETTPINTFYLAVPAGRESSSAVSAITSRLVAAF